MINSVLRGRLVIRQSQVHWLERVFSFGRSGASLSVQFYHQLNQSKLPKLELTLAIIKPHICKDPFSLEEIRQIILNDGFYYIRSCQKDLSTHEAEKFYEEHKGKFFYNRLVTFMTSGEIAVHVLARYNAIARWRELMGPTKVYRTRMEYPDTIRGRFGASDTRNATHGSDSVQSAAKEIAFFFPSFSIEQWYCQEEPFYRFSTTEKDEEVNDKGNNNRDDDGQMTRIDFDQRAWLHRIVRN